MKAATLLHRLVDYRVKDLLTYITPILKVFTV